MELFLPFPELWWKNFFYKLFLIRIKGFKINFQNRKWNYFSHFQTSDENLFYKMFLIRSKGFKINFQNREWNYSNRKCNYFYHFQASDQKKTITKCPRGSNLIYKTGYEIIQTGNGIISQTSRTLIKNFFFILFSFGPRGSNLIFETGYGIIQTGNGIIFTTLRVWSKNVYKMFLISPIFTNFHLFSYILTYFHPFHLLSPIFTYFQLF